MNAPESIEALLEEADAALDDGENEVALEIFEGVLERDPEHWGALLGRAEALHMLWRSEEALRAIRELVPPEDEEDDPDRADLEGRILEGLGRFEEADRMFAVASDLEPDEFPAAVRLQEEEFRVLLDKVLGALPRVIRDAVLEVPVVVEAKPTREMAGREPHINPEILGLFVGIPVGEKVLGGNGYGNVVLLFQRNLERTGRSREEVSREIKLTLLHEYGHYLGFDEEELEHLGLG
ncbi:MAG TPA: metallopeptidase family protein [Thermoplasmata archaeon]|nr:metallopeptidase family protein [Thermoplasmata archaeon]